MAYSLPAPSASQASREHAGQFSSFTRTEAPGAIINTDRYFSGSKHYLTKALKYLNRTRSKSLCIHSKFITKRSHGWSSHQSARGQYPKDNRWRQMKREDHPSFALIQSHIFSLGRIILSFSGNTHIYTHRCVWHDIPPTVEWKSHIAANLDSFPKTFFQFRCVVTFTSKSKSKFIKLVKCPEIHFNLFCPFPFIPNNINSCHLQPQTHPPQQLYSKINRSPVLLSSRTPLIYPHFDNIFAFPFPPE